MPFGTAHQLMERLPGFRDFFPEPIPHQDVWSMDARQWLFEKWRATAIAYGFREYDGPPLEPLELYTAKSGDEIVHQLYNFIDKGERPVALRPEMTPTLARLVAAHERQYRKPIKWFAIPQLFRYERQQKGRLREHFQLNADLFGEIDPAADAEIVALLIDTLRACGLDAGDFVIRLSSRAAWQHFFDSRGGLPGKTYEFYQAIDKLERDPPEFAAAKLAEAGIAKADVDAFILASEPVAELQAVVENLQSRGLGDYVKVDYGVMRGLAYYTGVIFEAFDRKGEFRAIAGGGRYDGLVKTISRGKVDLPGLGFGMGDVVLLELLKQRGLIPRFGPGVAVYCLVEEEPLRGDLLRLVQALRNRGVQTDYALTAMKPDKQFKRAQDLGAQWVARVRRNESGGVVCRIRHMGSREEREVSFEDAPGEIVKWRG